MLFSLSNLRPLMPLAVLLLSSIAHECRQNAGRSCTPQELAQPYSTLPLGMVRFYDSDALCALAAFPPSDFSNPRFINPSLVVYHNEIIALFTLRRAMPADATQCPKDSMYEHRKCPTRPHVNEINFIGHTILNSNFDVRSSVSAFPAYMRYIGIEEFVAPQGPKPTKLKMATLKEIFQRKFFQFGPVRVDVHVDCVKLMRCLADPDARADLGWGCGRVVQRLSNEKSARHREYCIAHVHPTPHSQAGGASRALPRAPR